VFDDVCGVGKGTPLRMKGVQIGQASELRTDLTTAEVTIEVVSRRGPGAGPAAGVGASRCWGLGPASQARPSPWRSRLRCRSRSRSRLRRRPPRAVLPPARRNSLKANRAPPLQNEGQNIIPAGSTVEINHSGLFGDTFLDVVLPPGQGHSVQHRWAGCPGRAPLLALQCLCFGTRRCYRRRC
jgi:hypothetical protein